MSEFNEWRLTEGQIALLETIKPLSEWSFELREFEINDNFGDIDELFWQCGRTITYDDFHFAGVDQTPKIDNSDSRVIELNYYRDTIMKAIRNSHYHGICNRVIKSFIIGYETRSFESIRSILLWMIDTYTSSGIVFYDYKTIRKSREIINREIHEAVYHPDRITKWLEAGGDLEDYLP